MIRRDGYIVWVQYFSRELSRSEGRRVPLRLAVKGPTAEDVLRAASRLGWEARKLDLRYPSEWWKPGCAVLVKPDRQMRKSQLLRKLAERMRG